MRILQVNARQGSHLQLIYDGRQLGLLHVRPRMKLLAHGRQEGCHRQQDVHRAGLQGDASRHSAAIGAAGMNTCTSSLVVTRAVPLHDWPEEPFREAERTSWNISRRPRQTRALHMSWVKAFDARTSSL